MRANSIPYRPIRLAAAGTAAIVFFFVVSFAQAESPWAVPVVGEPFQAEVAAVDAQWQMTFSVGQQPRVVSAAELVRWGRMVEQGGAGGLVFADGGWLVAEITAADKQSVAAESVAFGTLKLPKKSLAGVVVRPPAGCQDRDRLLDRIAAGPPAGEGQGGNAAGTSGESPSPNSPHPNPSPKGEGTDRLLLDNGDELTGRLLGIANDTIKFESDVGPIDVKTQRAIAILFGSPQRQPDAKGLRAWVGFSDGSRLLASQLTLQGDTLKLAASGQSLAASSRDLVFLQPLGGRAVYLSDLKPIEQEQTPFVSLAWPYRADRNVSGGLLRCAGRLYMKGLGVHSAARLVYDLSAGPVAGANWTPGHFVASVGIDDSTDGGGCVQFRVLVDGQERYASPMVRGGDRPLPISVDVSGGRRLELIVDYGDRADVLDHADWLDARLTD